MAPANTTTVRFSNLQLLRFLAAFVVVFFHALPSYLLLGGEKSSVITRLAWHGQFGVDIFFVISGFVIAATTLRKPRTLESSLNFACKRLLRIYLGYWPVFVWALVQTYFIAHQRLNVVNFPGSFMLTETNIYKLVLSVAWTLSYELYFYFMFTLLFFFSSTRAIHVVYLLFAVILLRVLFFPMEAVGPWYIFTSGLLLEFFAGVILYVHIGLLGSRWWLLLCAVCFFLPWLFVFDGEPSGDARVFSYGVSALASVCFMLLLEKHQIFTSSKLGERLGDASYTLYLVHTLLLQLFLVLAVQPYLVETPAAIRGISLAIVLGGIVLFSVLGYTLVERPLYRWALHLVADLPGTIAKKLTPGRWRSEL